MTLDLKQQQLNAFLKRLVTASKDFSNFVNPSLGLMFSF